jgi:hypothetical protein
MILLKIKEMLLAIEEFVQQYSADELHTNIEELLANYRTQLENLGQKGGLSVTDEKIEKHFHNRLRVGNQTQTRWPRPGSSTRRLQQGFPITPIPVAAVAVARPVGADGRYFYSSPTPQPSHGCFVCRPAAQQFQIQIAS